jgi:hypothetical protein
MMASEEENLIEEAKALIIAMPAPFQAQIQSLVESEVPAEVPAEVVREKRGKRAVWFIFFPVFCFLDFSYFSVHICS